VGQWRLTNFINVALKLRADGDLCKPARKTSGKNNARGEAFNGIFQAVKCRAEGREMMTRL